jgi:NADP-dependent 3-hydroxy acid dehydrogenase YdfG
MGSTPTDVRGVAVVTGASSGIGEATARALAQDGWHCVLLARRAERLQAVADEIGGEAAVCDVGDRELVDRVASEILGRHPRVSLLVNNAGMPLRATFADALIADVERVLAVNYLGAVWLTQALLPGLRAAARPGRSDGRRPCVANVASVAGTIAFARSGPYVAAKHAQVAFSRQLRVALGPEGIAVCTILPGFVATEGFPQVELLERRRTRWLVTSAAHVAAAIVDATTKERAEVTVPWFPYRLAGALQGIAPGLVRRFAGAEPGDVRGRRP